MPGRRVLFICHFVFVIPNRFSGEESALAVDPSTPAGVRTASRRVSNDAEVKLIPCLARQNWMISWWYWCARATLSILGPRPEP